MSIRNLCLVGLLSLATGPVSSAAPREADGPVVAFRGLEVDGSSRRDCLAGRDQLSRGQPAPALFGSAAGAPTVSMLNEELRRAGYRQPEGLSLPAQAGSSYAVSGTVAELCLHPGNATSGPAASVLVHWELTDERTGEQVYAKGTPAAAVLIDDPLSSATEAIRRGFRVFLALPGFRNRIGTPIAGGPAIDPPRLATAPELGSLSVPGRRPGRSDRGSIQHEEFRTSTWSRSVFWVGAAADMLTTAKVLDTPGLGEANPFLTRAGSGDSAILASAGVFKVGAYLIVRRGVRHGWISRGRGDTALAALGGGQLAAALHNHRKIRGR